MNLKNIKRTLCIAIAAVLLGMTCGCDDGSTYKERYIIL